VFDIIDAQCNLEVQTLFLHFNILSPPEDEHSIARNM